MIIMGYQGIGKSTLSNKEDGFIDLESGCFWHNGERISEWYIYYCQIAEHLSRQGNVVFVSSHKEVREFLRSSNERVICIYPSIHLSEEWKKKLHDRYENTKLTKDYKAWMNAEDRYAENISELMMCGIPHLEIDRMDYDLKRMIKDIMTYYDSYKEIGDADKIKEKAIRDTKMALFLGGNPDRIKAIEDAMNKAIKELEADGVS